MRFTQEQILAIARGARGTRSYIKSLEARCEEARLEYEKLKADLEAERQRFEELVSGFENPEGLMQQGTDHFRNW